MALYLLDTTVISELRRGPKTMDSHVLTWVEGVEIEQCYVSAVTILELEQGVLSKERSDVEQGKILRKWLEGFVYPVFEANTLAVSFEVVRKAAQFHIPDPAPVYDALIGATAAVKNAALVTRNTHDFERFGISLIDPWSQPTTH